VFAISNTVATFLTVVAAAGGAVLAGAIAYFGTRRQVRVVQHEGQADRNLQEQEALTHRFASASEQLGHDAAAVRLAGMSALARLADEWKTGRQMCIDVLCAYLRMPYEPQKAPSGEKEVRLTAARSIAERLRNRTWEGFDFDLTGALFDGHVSFDEASFSRGRFSFSRAQFSADVSFYKAQFSAGGVSFLGAQFSAGQVSFDHAQFSGGNIWFNKSQFSGGGVSFSGAEFSGGDVLFSGAQFSAGQVSFDHAQFSGGKVWFSGAEFSGGNVLFLGAQFSGGDVWFNKAHFSAGKVWFSPAEFSGGNVWFSGATFSGGSVWFSGAKFSGGKVWFSGAQFSGGKVWFSGAEFSGAEVDFSNPGDWTHRPTGLPDSAFNLRLPEHTDVDITALEGEQVPSPPSTAMPDGQSTASSVPIARFLEEPGGTPGPSAPQVRD
jgi:uncharacterized protein YjbI with pentapeptide repeats